MKKSKDNFKHIFGIYILSLLLAYSVLYWELISSESVTRSLSFLRYLLIFSIIFIPIAKGLTIIYAKILKIDYQLFMTKTIKIFIFGLLVIFVHFILDLYKINVRFIAITNIDWQRIIIESTLLPSLFWIAFSIIIALAFKKLKDYKNFIASFFIITGLNLITFFICYGIYWILGIIYMFATWG